jgi:hypothetical protein
VHRSFLKNKRHAIEEEHPLLSATEIAERVCLCYVCIDASILMFVLLVVQMQKLNGSLEKIVSLDQHGQKVGLVELRQLLSMSLFLLICSCH